MAAFAGIESWLLLYCRNNWSSLRCTDQEHGLRIRSQYPDDLIFTAAEPFVKLTPIKGKVFRSDSGEPISNSYITVEWQRKSQAFMEIVKLKGFSIEFDRENVKDFDGWAGKRRQVPGKRGGLNGSTQHQLEVYLQESQQLKSFASVDSNGTLPCLVLIEYSRTDRFSRGKYCRIN